MGIGCGFIGISGAAQCRLAYRRTDGNGCVVVFPGRFACGVPWLAIGNTILAIFQHSPWGSKVLGIGCCIDILERVTDRIVVCAAIPAVLRRSAFPGIYHWLGIPVCLYRIGGALFVCGARHAIVFACRRYRTFLCRNRICQMVTLRSVSGFDRATLCYSSLCYSPKDYAS